MEPYATRGRQESRGNYSPALLYLLHLLKGVGVHLLLVLCDDEKQEGRIHAPGQDELQHHGALNVREALVLLCRWERSNEQATGN